MGGNVFSNPSTKRYNRTQYEHVTKEIKTQLLTICTDVHILESTVDKQDFGDADILVTGATKDELIDLFVKYKKLDPKLDFSANGHVLSMRYVDFQIDLILTPKCDFSFSKGYFNHSDLGNLIGRVAHKMGFKFGHDGVWYVVRDGDYVVGECCLTKDFDKALAFFGFDVARYYKGFNTLDDIFKYVSSSFYFNRDLYPLEHRNHIARMRDRKRKTYTAFLKYCDEMEWDLDYIFYGEYIYLHKAFDAFPNFLVDYKILEEKLAQKRIIKSKFNGEIVRTITGFTDKALGQFIQHFKQWVTDGNVNNFEEYVLKSEADDVETDITHCLFSSRCYKNG